MPPAGLADDIGVATRGLDWAAGQLGLEMEAVDAAVPAFDTLLQRAAPAVA